MIETVAALLGCSTIVAAYGWHRCYAVLKSEQGWGVRWKHAYEEVFVIYADDRRKRLEAEQAHTDLADKHNTLLAKAYIRDGARFVRVVK